MNSKGWAKIPVVLYDDLKQRSAILRQLEETGGYFNTRVESSYTGCGFYSRSSIEGYTRDETVTVLTKEIERLSQDIGNKNLEIARLKGEYPKKKKRWF